LTTVQSVGAVTDFDETGANDGRVQTQDAHELPGHPLVA